MTVVERSIVINAPTNAVDAVTLDGRRMPEWYAGVESVEVDSTYPEVGGKVDMVYKASGLTFHMAMTTLELARGQYAVFKMEGMITGTTRWDYVPEGGGTRVTATFEYEMPGGGLGRIADKLVVERMNVSNLEKSLGNLKRVVEGG